MLAIPLLPRQADRPTLDAEADAKCNGVAEQKRHKGEADRVETGRDGVGEYAEVQEEYRYLGAGADDDVDEFSDPEELRWISTVAGPG